VKLKKKLRISSYGSKGQVIEILETGCVEFRKDGAMTIAWSARFQRAIDSVVEGGAIFIERFWGIE